MADQDANGYNDEGSDFKRNNNSKYQDDTEDVEEEQENPQNQKAQEYIKGMIAERLSIEKKYPIADRLLEVEIENVQKTGKPPVRRYIDIYREKHIKVSVKVLVPIREHPRFNFVGKLLGPKGNTLKRLQEDTLTKMAIMGRGSMKDRKKEEELRNSMDTKYAHLTDDLHVEVSANGPPAEVHARIAYALAELRKYLIPDSNDFIRQEQLRELLEDPESEIQTKKMYKKPMMQMEPPPPPTISVSRPTQAPNKILSILEKARVAMEDTHAPRQMVPQHYAEPGYDGYEQPSYSYQQGPPAGRPKYAPQGPEYEQEYRGEYYRQPGPYSAAPKPIPANAAARPWKPSPYGMAPRGGRTEDNSIKHGVREAVPRYRHTPYGRP